MVPQAPHVAHATLELLVEDWSVPILRALMVEPRRPTELEQHLPDMPHSALMRRLGQLHERGLASREHRAGLSPSTRYTLTTPGRMILDVMGAAERWERHWTEEKTDGLSGLSLIADERTREILLSLAPQPQSPGELESHLPLSRSPLRKRLADLVRRCILFRYENDGHVTYELTESARDLMLVSVAAARWQWECAKPDHPPLPRDIAHTLHMFAPRAQLPADLAGVCRLHVEDGPVVLLAAEGRRVATLAADPAHQPHATCHATPQAWCDGLLLRQWSGITSTGNRALMAAMLASVSTALLA